LLTPKIKHILVVLLFLSSDFVNAQKPANIKFKASLKMVENFGEKLKNTTIYLYRSGELIDSTYSKNATFKTKLSSGNLYKIEFTKKNYTSKHIVINTIGVPEKKRVKLKADISLFRYNQRWNVNFLKQQPVTIAYYNFIEKKLGWDFDYNRSVVEKIIIATIIK